MHARPVVAVGDEDGVRDALGVPLRKSTSLAFRSAVEMSAAIFALPAVAVGVQDVILVVDFAVARLPCRELSASRLPSTLKITRVVLSVQPSAPAPARLISSRMADRTSGDI